MNRHVVQADHYKKVSVTIPGDCGNNFVGISCMSQLLQDDDVYSFKEIRLKAS